MKASVFLITSVTLFHQHRLSDCMTTIYANYYGAVYNLCVYVLLQPPAYQSVVV